MGKLIQKSDHDYLFFLNKFNLVLAFAFASSCMAPEEPTYFNKIKPQKNILKLRESKKLKAL
jgi:hypothetical protein